MNHPSYEREEPLRGPFRRPSRPPFTPLTHPDFGTGCFEFFQRNSSFDHWDYSETFLKCYFYKLYAPLMGKDEVQ